MAARLCELILWYRYLWAISRTDVSHYDLDASDMTGASIGHGDVMAWVMTRFRRVTTSVSM